MKYKLEYHPNPDCVTIHLQQRLSKSMIHSFDSPDSKISVYKDNTFVSSKEPPIFIKRLWEVAGVRSISLRQFEICLTKGSCFEWDAMLEQIITLINLELSPDQDPEMLGKPQKPSREYLRSLRQQSCDV